MKKILFICHGNICRSPMAEIVMKDLVKKAGMEEKYEVASAATTSEEIWNGIGNPVYPPARAKLREHGLSSEGKRARLMTRADYDEFDFLVGMDTENLYDMKRIAGGDPEGKISLLMDYTTRPRSVADPWYTGDFEATWRDVSEGTKALLAYLENL